MAKKAAKKKAKDKKIKYDWPTLKQEFFESDHMEVKAFLKSKYGRFSGHMSVQSNGWPKEKNAWKQENIKAAQIAFRENKAKEIAQMLEDVQLLLRKEIKNRSELALQDVDALKKLWEMVRTESELPTRIIHSTNKNLNYDADKVKSSLLNKIKDKKMAPPPPEISPPPQVEKP